MTNIYYINKTLIHLIQLIQSRTNRNAFSRLKNQTDLSRIFITQIYQIKSNVTVVQRAPKHISNTI